MLPVTLPMITTSRALILAAITPLRPTVTRCSARLMVPSIFPSTYSDSAPLISPLITSERPMVACSVGTVVVFAGAKEFGFEENWVFDEFLSGDCSIASTFLESERLRQEEAACGGALMLAFFGATAEYRTDFRRTQVTEEPVRS